MKVYVVIYPSYGEQSPVDVFLSRDEASAARGTGGVIVEAKPSLA